MKRSYRSSLELQRQRYQSMLHWRRVLAKRAHVEAGRQRVRDNSTPFIENPTSLADAEHIIERIRALQQLFLPSAP